MHSRGTFDKSKSANLFEHKPVEYQNRAGQKGRIIESSSFKKRARLHKPQGQGILICNQTLFLWNSTSDPIK